MIETLRPYQIEGAHFLRARRHALLADEMRLGKTPQAIQAAVWLGAGSAITVCPAIARPQWKREWNRWGPSVEARVWSFDELRVADLTGVRCDVAIVDECHFAGNPAAQRTRKVYAIDGLAWHSDKMWALSGTPAKKHAAELWAMFVCFGLIRMPYDVFVREFCTVDPMTLRITGTKSNRIPEIRALLAQCMLRRTRKQVFKEMAPIEFDMLSVDLATRVDLPEGVQDRLEDGGYEILRREVALAKVPALADEIVECLDRGDYKQTVVFAWHRDSIKALCDLLSVHGVTASPLIGGLSDARREATIAMFQLGQTQVLVAQIAAAGTAVDLSAASHGYFLELDWVPANNVQAANRLVSVTKDEAVTFDVCSAPGTNDEIVESVLLRRARELATLFG